MTTRKPAAESTPPAGEPDALDASEWEHGQHTPEVGTDKLTALVKESATRTPPTGVPTSTGKHTIKRAPVNQDDIITAPTPKLDDDELLVPSDAVPAPVPATTDVSRRTSTTKPPPVPAAARRSATPSTPPTTVAETTSPAGGRKRTNTLSPTAFIRSSGDTAPPPTLAFAKPSSDQGRRSPTLPPVLPRAAAPVALGNIRIEEASIDAGIPTTNADDGDSKLIALLSMPTGEERRARKATLPPPPPQQFPILEEEIAQALPSVPKPEHAGPVGAARTSSSKVRRNIAIIGGVVVLLVVVLVFALGGGDDNAKSVAKTTEPAVEKDVAAVEERVAAIEKSVAAIEENVAAAEKNDAAVEQVVPEVGSGSAAASEEVIEMTPPEEAGSATTTATTATTTTADAAPKASPMRERLNALLKGKTVVLEYDGRAAKNSAPDADQAAIAKARAATATGTQRLNTRDYEGALESYRRALGLYPGYIGAYRGMGLAYERKGDKANALKALRMYVSIVPQATDVATMRLHIDALTKR